MKCYLASLCALILMSASASGLSMKITSPEIGYRSSIGESQTAKVSALVDYMDKDLQFMDGMFINEYSQQRFGGSSEKVARFIMLLEEAKLWDVQVLFRDFGEQESAFSLGQNSTESVRLIINSGRKDFSLNDFAAYLQQPSGGFIKKNINKDFEYLREPKSGR